MKETRHVTLTEQLDRAVAADFPQLVGESRQQYTEKSLALFENISKQNKDITVDQWLTFVDPRIPFTLQLKSLGIGLDPSIYPHPHHNEKSDPYTTTLEMVHLFDRKMGHQNYKDTVGKLPESYQAATPFDGLLIAPEILSTKFFMAFAGGEYDEQPSITNQGKSLYRYHTLETFFGKPRISYVFADSYDYFVTVGATLPHHAVMQERMAA